MNNHQNAIELVKALSGQANVLTIPRLYIDYMGSIDGGLLLNQLIYWSDKGADNEEWFYKTYLEWESETTLSKYEVSKQADILKEKGVLQTKVKKANGAPTVHYKFLFSEFQNSIVKFINFRKSRNFTIDSEVSSLSLTETTTEITTEKEKPISANADYSLPISLLSEKEIKELKLPLSGWKQHLEDEQAERGRKGVTSFLEKKIATGPLLPDTPDSQLLFEKLAVEAEAKGRYPPGLFPTLACKEKFSQAAARLNGTLETAIDSGLEQGITAIPKLVSYVASSKWQQKGETTNATIERREGKNSEGQSAPVGQALKSSRANCQPQTAGHRAPLIGSGQTPEMRERLRTLFPQ